MLLGENCSEEAAKTKGKVLLKSSGNQTLPGFFVMWTGDIEKQVRDRQALISGLSRRHTGKAWSRTF